MALDLGKKRCGVAVTDIMQIVATGLAVIPTTDIEKFISEYVNKESVDYFLIGNPLTLRGEPSESMRYIVPVINRLRNLVGEEKIKLYDERFTSTLAHRSMLECGMKKSNRQKKENADIMSATIMLNDYLESKAIRK